MDRSLFAWPPIKHLQDWTYGWASLTTQREIWFSDKSKSQCGTGAVVDARRQGTGTSIPFGQLPTIFQAELTVITHCAYLALEREKSGMIYFCLIKNVPYKPGNLN